MASFLKSIKTELHEENPDLSAVGPRSNSTSTKEKQKAIHVLQNTSACEVKKFLNGGVFPNSVHSYQNTTDICKSICGEPSAFSVPESFDSVVCGVSKEHTASETTIKGDTETSVNSSMHYEPLSRDSHQDSHDDPRNHKLDMSTSCTLRKSRPSKNAIKDSSDVFVHLNNSGHDSRGYSDKIPELETHMPPRNWATEPCPILPKDKCMPCYVQIPDQHGVSRTYANFTITKEFKDATRTFHSLKRHRDFSANGSLLSSWTRTWHVADDLTQNSLDLEYLCFAHKLKQILKKGDSQPSVSTSSSPEELRAQISVEAFPSTEISESPIPHLPPRSRSPILVTVVHSDTRQQSWHRRGHSSSNLVGSSSFWKERCGHSRIPSSERNLTVPFHLNKLKYSTLKEARNDISLILNEYAEFNKVMIQSNQVLQDKGLSVASEEAVSHETCHLFPRQSASYKDVIADLCATLHVKLKGVLREACKTPFRFYLVETEDKSFF
ncbi:protein FAM208B, partial [Nannospalax galili]|uniref:protein FAM208B n=1 Tax=Nannospalax galili TaxID=1026970 RepID=UPI000819F66F